jgi:hypothetical protein
MRLLLRHVPQVGGYGRKGAREPAKAGAVRPCARGRIVSWRREERADGGVK